MKFFTNKSIWTKIIIVLIIVILFEFIIAKPSLGASVGETAIEFGGTLLSPLLSLVVSLADGMMGLLHSSIMGINESLVAIDNEASMWEIIGKIFVVAVAVISAIAVICSAVATGGATVPLLLGTIAKAVGSIAAIAGKAAVAWFVVDLGTSSAAVGMSDVSASYFGDEITLPSTLYLPIFSISPEEIFQGKILLFNVDFIGEQKQIYAQGTNANGEEVEVLAGSSDENNLTNIERYFYKDTDENGNEIKVTTSKQNLGADLSNTIARWYVGIRNIALVLMMIVLLYIGIRMALSTLANDKAKYKQMLYDWLIGIMLLFLMHYIMAFSVMIVQKLTDVISASVDQKGYAVRMPVDDNGKMVEYFNDNGLSYLLYDENGNIATGREDEDGSVKADESNVAYVMYTTNMMGKLRLDTQLTNWGTAYIGYAICYVVLVMYTCFFVFTYLKRVLYMAFLTMIAPMVALTYPIDKINDGSAQGFDRWFKEYIFNLLIQPMHLLLYFVLVTSAFDLAGQNLIYSIVAIGFMIPAEKLLRSFFGFEKAHTPGVLAGPAGAALTMTGISKMVGLLGGHKKGGNGKEAGGGKNGGSSEDDEGKGLRFKKDFNETQALAEQGNDQGEQGDQPDYAKEAIDKYSNEGFGKNANGEYFNPWTNEYDADYDPTRDKEYNRGLDAANQNTNTDTQSSKYRINRDSALRAQNAGKPKLKLKNRAARSLKANKYRVIQGLARGSAKVIQGTGRIAGAVTLGAIGAAAGIAAGDPSQVFTNMTAAGGAGYIAGKTISDNQTQRLRTTNIGDKTYNRVMNDPQYQELNEDAQLRKMRKDYKEAFLDNGYDKDTVKSLLDDGTINRYIKNNITAKDALTIEKMREENPDMTQTQGMAYAEYAKRVGDEYKGPKRKEWIDHFSTEYQEKANKDARTSARLANETMKKIDKFNKVKKDIK